MSLRDDLRRVEVEWLDSVALSGWRDPDQVERELLGDANAMLHVTVGLLLHEADDRIVVALSAGASEDPQIDAALAIPRAAVLAIRDLR